MSEKSAAGLIFVDCETTGLDPERHDLIEVAWATLDGPAQRMLVDHSLLDAEPEALAVNGYYERGLDAEPTTSAEVATDVLNRVLRDRVFVGSNPAFDQAFLSQFLGCEPWHYRKVDVTSMAMVMLGMEVPASLSSTIVLLNESFGLSIPAQRHTAEDDVYAARAVYKAVMEWRSRLPAFR